jgi:hypothetical protein
MSSDPQGYLQAMHDSEHRSCRKEIAELTTRAEKAEARHSLCIGPISAAIQVGCDATEVCLWCQKPIPCGGGCPPGTGHRFVNTRAEKAEAQIAEMATVLKDYATRLNGQPGYVYFNALMVSEFTALLTPDLENLIAEYKAGQENTEFVTWLSKVAPETMKAWRSHCALDVAKQGAAIPCAFTIGLTACGYPSWECMHIGSPSEVVPPAGRHVYTPSVPADNARKKEGG